MQHPSVKAKLGNRYTCFQCGTKFYDLNRDPLCPDCSADQREAPVRDIRSLLFPGKGRRKEDSEEEEDFDLPIDEDDEDEDDDDMGLLGVDDEDDESDDDDFEDDMEED